VRRQVRQERRDLSACVGDGGSGTLTLALFDDRLHLIHELRDALV
jgi:hypothetical protein